MNKSLSNANNSNIKQFQYQIYFNIWDHYKPYPFFYKI